VVAEKFEPLIGGGAVARPAQRGNVGECLFEQRGILESVADALFEGGRVAATALCRLWNLAGLPSASGMGASMEVSLPVRPRLILRS